MLHILTPNKHFLALGTYIHWPALTGGCRYDIDSIASPNSRLEGVCSHWDRTSTVAPWVTNRAPPETIMKSIFTYKANKLVEKKSGMSVQGYTRAGIVAANLRQFLVWEVWQQPLAAEVTIIVYDSLNFLGREVRVFSNILDQIQTSFSEAWIHLQVRIPIWWEKISLLKLWHWVNFYRGLD
jgi:hypothetical protein